MDATNERTLYVDTLRADEVEPDALHERTHGADDARTHDARRAPGDDPSPPLAGDGTPVPVESYRDVASSATHLPLHPALVNPDLSPTLPALQAEGLRLISEAAVAALRAADFQALLEREMRLNTLNFLRTMSRFFRTDDKSSPSVVLNNIITSIPRGPLDALPEGFRRN